MKMCDLSDYTTKKTMQADLYLIKSKLMNVEVTNPKIYKAIQPLVSHLIEHLEKVHDWIEPLPIPQKSDRQIEKEAHDKWFDEKNIHLDKEFNYYKTKKELSRKSWLTAKGYCA